MVFVSYISSHGKVIKRNRSQKSLCIKEIDEIKVCSESQNPSGQSGGCQNTWRIFDVFSLSSNTERKPIKYAKLDPSEYFFA